MRGEEVEVNAPLGSEIYQLICKVGVMAVEYEENPLILRQCLRSRLRSEDIVKPMETLFIVSPSVSGQTNTRVFELTE